MTDEKSDFIAKLRQMEEQANLGAAGLPPGLLRSRLQHIAVLAKTLRGRLEPAGVSIVRIDPEATLPDEPEKPTA